MAKAKFTDEQVKYFFNRVDYYQERLNLLNWHVGHSKKRPKDCMANVDISYEDHTATVALGTGWGSMEVNEENLDRTALHEMLHVFLTTYKETCITHNDILIMSAEHSAIAVLEKIIK